jgi:hypothetical protein
MLKTVKRQSEPDQAAKITTKSTVLGALCIEGLGRREDINT